MSAEVLYIVLLYMVHIIFSLRYFRARQVVRSERAQMPWELRILSRL